MKIKREVVLLVVSAFTMLFGWILLAHTEQIAITVLGCAEGMTPCPDSSVGIYLDPSTVEKTGIWVQIAGMALCVGGAVSILVGAINSRTR